MSIKNYRDRKRLEFAIANAEQNQIISRVAFISLAENAMIPAETLLQHVEMFDAWEPNVKYNAGKMLRHEGQLWRVRQAHTSQAIYPPSIDTAALYVMVAEPNEDEGTLNNPIAFAVGMELVAGKFYMDEDTLYECTRELNACYWPLRDVIGTYVEAIRNEA